MSKRIFASTLKVIVLHITALLLLSCTPKHWVITEYKTTKISIDSTTESLADKKMQAFTTPLKQNLDKEMNVVIAQSVQEMKSGKPESLLSNWTSEVYRVQASTFLKSPVDVGIVNMGSMRSPLPKGNIKVRDIFQLMPFENELVLLWLKGSDLNDLLQIFAKEGGQAVSNIRMDIKNKEAVNILIDGKPLDKEKIYSIATNDYLAAGNDRMTPLTAPVKRVDTNLKIRNIIMEYVIRENLNGRKLESKLDGRIKVL